MKIAVVTPYYKEPSEILLRAHRSVAAQTCPGVLHVMVADGVPSPDVAAWDVHHLILPRSHGDNGNTPRAYGTDVAARDLGCDAVAYLDADNWFEPDHLSTLVEACEATGSEVAASGRVVRGLDGEVLLPSGEARDGVTHFDTSCFLVRGRALYTSRLWTECPAALTAMCDTVFLYGLLFHGFAVAATGRATLNFQSHYMAHYMQAWRQGGTMGSHLPCRPNRLYVQAEEAFKDADARALVGLFRGAVPAQASDETEDDALLRFGSFLARMGATHHALPFLRAVGPQERQGDIVRHNLGAALARQVAWEPGLAEDAEQRLRESLDGPASGAAAHNLSHMLVRCGRLAEVVPLLDVPVASPEGYVLAKVGGGPFLVLVKEHWIDGGIIAPSR